MEGADAGAGGADRSSRTGRPAGASAGAAGWDADPGTARQEAERLVASLLGAASMAARGMGRGPAGPRSGGGFGALGDALFSAVRGEPYRIANGTPECCVCPVCRVIAALRDPDPEVAERLATGAGDLAAGVASLLRSLSGAFGEPGAGASAGWAGGAHPHHAQATRAGRGDPGHGATLGDPDPEDLGPEDLGPEDRDPAGPDPEDPDLQDPDFPEPDPQEPDPPADLPGDPGPGGTVVDRPEPDDSHRDPAPGGADPGAHTPPGTVPRSPAPPPAPTAPPARDAVDADPWAAATRAAAPPAGPAPTPGATAGTQPAGSAVPPARPRPAPMARKAVRPVLRRPAGVPDLAAEPGGDTPRTDPGDVA